jgi:hypothetical protein
MELDALADDLRHIRYKTQGGLSFKKTYPLGEGLSFTDEYDISFYEVGIQRLNDC